MRIDLYHLYRQLHFTNFGFPHSLGTLATWAEEVGHELRVRICREKDVYLSTDADAVGISVYTQTAPAAFRLSRELRARGKIVVLGGPHFRGPDTYQEAARQCDAVVSSICREQWQSLLDKISSGRIRPGARPALFIADGESRFRYCEEWKGLSAHRRWYHLPTVPTSLGCPYNCSFCSPFMQGEYHPREVASVCREISRIDDRGIMICDATFGLNKAHTLRLMEAITPHKKKIIVETTAARLMDRDILRAMARGGVKWVIIGIESLAMNLKKHGAGNAVENILRAIGEARELDMVVQGNIICGLDSDGPESFEVIYDFYERSGLDLLMVGILTPYPNTQLYRDLLREKRIIDGNWEHYDGHHVVYRPRKMSTAELAEGYLQLYRSVSGLRAISRRTIGDILHRGLCLETFMPLAFRSYSWYDSHRKKRSLCQRSISPQGVCSESSRLENNAVQRSGVHQGDGATGPDDDQLEAHPPPVVS